MGGGEGVGRMKKKSCHFSFQLSVSCNLNAAECEAKGGGVERHVEATGETVWVLEYRQEQFQIPFELEV